MTFILLDDIDIILVLFISLASFIWMLLILGAH